MEQSIISLKRQEDRDEGAKRLNENLDSKFKKRRDEIDTYLQRRRDERIRRYETYGDTVFKGPADDVEMTNDVLEEQLEALDETDKEYKQRLKKIHKAMKNELSKKRKRSTRYKKKVDFSSGDDIYFKIAKDVENALKMYKIEHAIYNLENNDKKISLREFIKNNTGTGKEHSLLRDFMSEKNNEINVAPLRRFPINETFKRNAMFFDTACKSFTSDKLANMCRFYLYLIVTEGYEKEMYEEIYENKKVVIDKNILYYDLTRHPYSLARLQSVEFDGKFNRIDPKVEEVILYDSEAHSYICGHPYKNSKIETIIKFTYENRDYYGYCMDSEADDCIVVTASVGKLIALGAFQILSGNSLVYMQRATPERVILKQRPNARDFLYRVMEQKEGDNKKDKDKYEKNTVGYLAFKTKPGMYTQSDVRFSDCSLIGSFVYSFTINAGELDTFYTTDGRVANLGSLMVTRNDSIANVILDDNITPATLNIAVSLLYLSNAPIASEWANFFIAYDEMKPLLNFIGIAYTRLVMFYKALSKYIRRNVHKISHAMKLVETGYELYQYVKLFRTSPVLADAGNKIVKFGELMRKLGMGFCAKFYEYICKEKYMEILLEEIQSSVSIKKTNNVIDILYQICASCIPGAFPYRQVSLDAIEQLVKTVREKKKVITMESTGDGIKTIPKDVLNTLITDYTARASAAKEKRENYRSDLHVLRNEKSKYTADQYAIEYNKLKQRYDDAVDAFFDIENDIRSMKFLIDGKLGIDELKMTMSNNLVSVLIQYMKGQSNIRSSQTGSIQSGSIQTGPVQTGTTFEERMSQSLIRAQAKIDAMGVKTAAASPVNYKGNKQKQKIENVESKIIKEEDENIS